MKTRRFFQREQVIRKPSNHMLFFLFSYDFIWHHMTRDQRFCHGFVTASDQRLIHIPFSLLYYKINIYEKYISAKNWIMMDRMYGYSVHENWKNVYLLWKIYNAYVNTVLFNQKITFTTFVFIAWFWSFVCFGPIIFIFFFHASRELFKVKIYIYSYSFFPWKIVELEN